MLIEKAKETIKGYRLISKNDRILIGVSGGPDSVTLLYVLNSLKKELNLKLHVAHLDHKLRKDSFKDRQFVEELARKLKIPFIFLEVKRGLLEEGGSLEEAARKARFEFFFKVAKKIKADKIALGHNLDDQAETVLMRILRGTGLYGLGAILAKRKIDGFVIIRPLIEISRRQIELFLKRKKIKPRIDESNFSDVYFRNKIRNHLLPILEKNYNRNIKVILNNLAQTSASDYDCLAGMAKKFFKDKKARLKLDRIKRLHPAFLRLILRLKLSTLRGNSRRITFQHTKELEDLIYNRPAKSVVDLPQGARVIKTEKSLIFLRKKTQ